MLLTAFQMAELEKTESKLSISITDAGHESECPCSSCTTLAFLVDAHLESETLISSLTEPNVRSVLLAPLSYADRVPQWLASFNESELDHECYCSSCNYPESDRQGCCFFRTEPELVGLDQNFEFLAAFPDAEIGEMRCGLSPSFSDAGSESEWETVHSESDIDTPFFAYYDNLFEDTNWRTFAPFDVPSEQKCSSCSMVPYGAACPSCSHVKTTPAITLSTPPTVICSELDDTSCLIPTATYALFLEKQDEQLFGLMERLEELGMTTEEDELDFDEIGEGLLELCIKARHHGLDPDALLSAEGKKALHELNRTLEGLINEAESYDEEEACCICQGRDTEEPCFICEQHESLSNLKSRMEELSILTEEQQQFLDSLWEQIVELWIRGEQESLTSSGILTEELEQALHSLKKTMEELIKNEEDEIMAEEEWCSYRVDREILELMENGDQEVSEKSSSRLTHEGVECRLVVEGEVYEWDIRL